VHPVFGNNAQLADSLGLRERAPFLPLKGVDVGLRAKSDMPVEDLVERLQQSLGGSKVKLYAHGSKRTQHIGIVTGGAGGEISAVAAAGIDTFITGEAPHWAAIAAQELGINLLLGGHYATETFGVKALAAHFARRFSLEWEFIDLPSGL
jgi:putative NIF3 family GTP cyclohydrolase 1 type 2